MTGLPHSQLHSHKKWLKQLYQIVFLASDRELIQLRKCLAGETKWCCLSECPPHLLFICTSSPGNNPINIFPTHSQIPVYYFTSQSQSNRSVPRHDACTPDLLQISLLPFSDFYHSFNVCFIGSLVSQNPP